MSFAALQRRLHASKIVGFPNMAAGIDASKIVGFPNMAAGIDASEIVLVFVTKNYNTKVAGLGPRGQGGRARACPYMATGFHVAS